MCANLQVDAPIRSWVTGILDLGNFYHCFRHCCYRLSACGRVGLLMPTAWPPLTRLSNHRPAILFLSSPVLPSIGMTIGWGFLRVEEFRCWSERSFRNSSVWMMTLANPTTRTTTGIDGFGWFVHALNHVWCKFSYCSASFVNSSTYVHFYHRMAFYEGHKMF